MMIELNVTSTIMQIIYYIVIGIILLGGTKLHFSCLDLSIGIERKTFIFKWVICFIIQMVIFLTSIYFNEQDNMTFRIWFVCSVILLMIYHVVLISGMVQRCLNMVYSKILIVISLIALISSEIFYTMDQFTLLIVYLFMGLLPNEKY